MYNDDINRYKRSLTSTGSSRDSAQLTFMISKCWRSRAEVKLYRLDFGEITEIPRHVMCRDGSNMLKISSKLLGFERFTSSRYLKHILFLFNSKYSWSSEALTIRKIRKFRKMHHWFVDCFDGFPLYLSYDSMDFPRFVCDFSGPDLPD